MSKSTESKTEMKCDACDRSVDGNYRCSKCQTAVYCGYYCMKNMEDKHKTECNEMVQVRNEIDKLNTWMTEYHDEIMTIMVYAYTYGSGFPSIHIKDNKIDTVEYDDKIKLTEQQKNHFNNNLNDKPLGILLGTVMRVFTITLPETGIDKGITKHKKLMQYIKNKEIERQKAKTSTPATTPPATTPPATTPTTTPPTTTTPQTTTTQTTPPQTATTATAATTTSTTSTIDQVD